MQSLIKSKLDDFFDVAEYVWTPNHKENEPSMYLYGLVDWLTTVVDDMVIKGTYKDDAYMSAAAYMADSFVVGDTDCPRKKTLLTIRRNISPAATSLSSTRTLCPTS